ncbi:MAG TPA: class I SAM-dependent methyltransferase [Candidatus Binataceae bacterium]|nr:class I SAM-dependent methyltransferase [Candidatus Binataceae bacterium]
MADLLKSNFFRRVDETDDEEFYRAPRRVVHIDDGAIAAVGEIFVSRVAPGSEILDLMSSWRSHIPKELKPARVVGLGLNREEMSDNPALSEIVVHDVNREPRLPFADSSFDAALITVSVQYLTRPIEVFAEVGRVLRVSKPFIVSFSNRMFPTKAVALWQASGSAGRVAVVTRYFEESGAFEQIEVIDRSERPGAPSDPIWAVIGYRR